MTECFGFDNEGSENYEGTIDVSIARMPKISLTSIEFQPSANWLQRLAIATRKRHFTLAEDWQVAFCRIKSTDRLNGFVTIPREYQNEELEYDGASVPLPWLISFLSIGTLRPLGVMLIPSIVHDFAFQFGVLLVAETPDATPEPIKIERHEADDLFYDMIRTLNGDILTATLAHLAVRLGWPFVRYSGKLRGGKPPIAAYLAVIFVLILAAAVSGVLIVSLGWVEAIAWIAGALLGSYFLAWSCTCLVLQALKKSD